MNFSINLLLAVGLLATSLTDSAAATSSVVKVNQAKVRAKPSSNSEVLTNLKQGDTAVILGEQADPEARSGEPRRWARIEMPKHVPVWLAANLIDPKSKKVKVDRINLRAGPGKNFSQLGQITKGTVVNEIRTEDGWMQIEAPPGCIAYMAAELLATGSLGAAGGRSASASRSPSAPPPPIPKANAAPSSASTPVVETLPPVVANAKPPILPDVDPPKSGGSVSTPRALTTDNPVVESKPSTEAVPLETVAPAPDLNNSSEAIRPGGNSVSGERRVAIDEIQYQLAPRVVSREGVVAETWSAAAPSYLELNSFRRREGLMNYLFTDDLKIDLNSFRNKHVLLAGEEWVDARWPKTPVLRVQKIEAIDY
ncbi:MAG: hypothetical protein EXS36_08395 [Pedosphaera sp.]|nr:hypothetical protein [Pedosphaera sp.]